MKIALLGYGKMGKEVETIAREKSHTIVLMADADNPIDKKGLSAADVAIDFSTPEHAPDNILSCFSVDVPVVVGTTGWYDKLGNIKQACLANDQALIYASNFSIGVNIFFELSKKLAQLMNEQSLYEVSIEENHHKQKLDAPSGTAITLADNLIGKVSRKKSWVSHMKGESIGRELSAHELEITSIREENVIGMHRVKFSSDVDSVEIKHEAKSRKGFAMGAVMAAEWILGKKGVYTIGDMLNSEIIK